MPVLSVREGPFGREFFAGDLYDHRIPVQVAPLCSWGPLYQHYGDFLWDALWGWADIIMEELSQSETVYSTTVVVMVY
jgi:hypothetical protein